MVHMDIVFVLLKSLLCVGEGTCHGYKQYSGVHYVIN